MKPFFAIFGFFPYFLNKISGFSVTKVVNPALIFVILCIDFFAKMVYTYKCDFIFGGM